MEVNQFLSLFEMPVGALSTIGDFTKAHSFRHPSDRRLLTNPTYIEKIKTAFSRTPFLFDLYFVNKPGLAGGNYLERGLVPTEFIFSKHVGRRDQSGADATGLGLDPQTFKLNDEAITVFFTNNTGAERMPMTAWIIAHRVGHAMRRLHKYQEMVKYVERKFQELAACYGINRASYGGYGYDDYNQVRKSELSMKYLAQAVCTMRSARNQNLRNFGEIQHELFAQYLLDGKVAFNPAPQSIPVSFTWGRPNHRRCQNVAQVQSILDLLAVSYHNWADNVLSEAVAQCFVM